MHPIRLGVTFQRISCNKCSTNLSVPGRTGITVKFVQIESTNVVRDSLIPSALLERLTRSLHGFYRIYGRICRAIRPPRNSRSRVNWERRPEHLRRVAPCIVWVQGAWGIRGDNWKKKYGMKMSHDEFFMETRIRKKKEPTNPNRWVEDRAETTHVSFITTINIYNII
nr:uncharacterized protein LOC117274054 [Nicotiana tomentosiformis]